MKKILYNVLGFICLGLAYIGVVTPGIPFSIFIVIASWAFAKGNDRMHKWLYNHKLFGKFLTNWTNKRVFPFYAKISMVIMMSLSVLLLWLHNSNGTIYVAITCVLVAIWAWRYPSSIEEHDRRVSSGKRVAWLK
jgi:uncharacterized protein